LQIGENIGLIDVFGATTLSDCHLLGTYVDPSSGLKTPLLQIDDEFASTASKINRRTGAVSGKIRSELMINLPVQLCLRHHPPGVRGCRCSIGSVNTIAK